MRRAALLAVVLGLAGTAPAVAQGAAPYAPPPGAPPARPQPRLFRDRFAAANATHDGRLTLAQAEAGGLRGVARNFAAIDAGHKGYVTLPDIRAFRRARQAARLGTPPG